MKNDATKTETTEILNEKANPYATSNFASLFLDMPLSRISKVYLITIVDRVKAQMPGIHLQTFIAIS